MSVRVENGWGGCPQGRRKGEWKKGRMEGKKKGREEKGERKGKGKKEGTERRKKGNGRNKRKRKRKSKREREREGGREKKQQPTNNKETKKKNDRWKERRGCSAGKSLHADTRSKFKKRAILFYSLCASTPLPSFSSLFYLSNRLLSFLHSPFTHLSLLPPTFISCSPSSLSHPFTFFSPLSGSTGET